MLRLSVCSCSFRFYPPVGVSPCLWCRTVLCCDVLFVCSWFRHCIDCRLLLYGWLGLLCLLCAAGSFTVLWLFTARHLYCWLKLYCVLTFLYSKRTVLFTVCAYWLLPAVWLFLLNCCILPLFVWSLLVGKRFPVVRELRGVIVRLVAGRGIGRGWVVGFILWISFF